MTRNVLFDTLPDNPAEDLPVNIPCYDGGRGFQRIRAHPISSQSVSFPTLDVEPEDAPNPFKELRGLPHTAPSWSGDRF